ncbi:hypothetical protein QVD17_17412 [Tagetes erecta]|uniref:Uncharacterized protein n=1 Tax=Tagetes erecta TaxID=13708 RepID=A0AAD8KTV2_TARER|nr:hypothetical protein QVD17_17412 [Tagetes erecta]
MYACTERVVRSEGLKQDIEKYANKPILSLKKFNPSDTNGVIKGLPLQQIKIQEPHFKISSFFFLSAKSSRV